MNRKYQLKELLYDLFSPLGNRYPDFKIIGDEATFSFDNDRYAKLAFTKYATHGTPNASVFNGCEINIMSRTKGQLDMKRIAFSDVFDSILDLNHPNKIGKYIWRNDGYDWYGKPTAKDKQDLYNAVENYLDIFKVKEEPEKVSLDQLLTAAIEKTSRESYGKTDYDKAIGFIKELKEMAVSAEKLSNDGNELDYELMKSDIVDKLLNFNEKSFIKDNINKNTDYLNK